MKILYNFQREQQKPSNKFLVGLETDGILHSVMHTISDGYRTNNKQKQRNPEKSSRIEMLSILPFQPGIHFALILTDTENYIGQRKPVIMC